MTRGAANVIGRRGFIRIMGTVGGGLVLGVSFSGCRRSDAEDAVAFTPNAFLRIGNDGSITFTAPVPEIGQGVRTSLCMLMAEELGVGMAAIRIEQADADSARYGNRQQAAGSWSVRTYWTPLRQAGASAREMLVAAAAARWGVTPGACTAKDGAVVHGRRRLSYGELADAASRMPVPEQPRLKEPAEFTIIGRPVANADITAITDGSAPFGLDVKVPGMVYAVIERCPVLGGRPTVVDDSAARRVAGVLDVIALDPVGTLGRPSVQGGVAVVASSTWAALKGRSALEVEWNEGPNARESTAALHRDCARLVARRGEVVRESGTPYERLQSASRVVDMVYAVPFLAHAPLEPMNCVAHVQNGRCEVWAPTQVPGAALATAAGLAGVPESETTVHVMRSGGGFGRRLDVDYLREAVVLSKRLGRPVQVVWTREDDMRHGFCRPFGYQRVIAGLDARGRLDAWVHRVASTSRYAFRSGVNPAAAETHPDDFPSRSVANVSLEFAPVTSSVPRGPLRAPRDNANVFVTESALDEVAHEAGRDPLEFRLEVLGDDRDIAYDLGGDAAVFRTGRLRRVLELAARAAGWGSAPAPGRGRGIAANFTFGTYVAQVAEVSVDRAAGRLVVHRMTAAIDCGLAVNPAGVRAQVEGGIVDGLSSLYREITFERGRVQQSSFDNYRMLRIDETPDIQAIIVQSAAPPSGAGEPPFPAVAPAVTNAIFAATGVRVRQLPLRAEVLRG